MSNRDRAGTFSERSPAKISLLYSNLILEFTKKKEVKY